MAGCIFISSPLRPVAAGSIEIDDEDAFPRTASTPDVRGETSGREPDGGRSLRVLGPERGASSSKEPLLGE